MLNVLAPPSEHLGSQGSPAAAVVALIPAYNEQRFIGSLVLAVQPYVEQVIVVDDGSHDRTAEIARLAGATVVQHRTNQGKAAGVNTGFAYLRQLNPAVVVMLDGDGQHNADDIPMVIAPVLEGRADVVVGSRFLSIRNDIPTYRQAGQHSLTMITNVASGVRVGDSQSGFRAFSRRALERLSFGQGGFSIESEMQFLAREYHLHLVEVPISVVYAERAKRNPVAHGLEVVHGILKLVGQIRPLLYFGMMGSGVSTIGAALGLYVIHIYGQTQQLAVGYALLTVMLMVLGMVLFFVGVVLHSMRGMVLELKRGLLERLAGERATDRAPSALASAEVVEHEAHSRLAERAVGAEYARAR